jgi:hypothetical protein
MRIPNKPAAGNAGIASRLTIEHHWPGVPEPELGVGPRMQTSNLIVGLVVLSAAIVLFGAKQLKRCCPPTVSFAGYTNSDKYSSARANFVRQIGGTPDPVADNYGKCVRLAFANSERCALQFYSLKAEYQADGRWEQANPERWSGFNGFWLSPGKEGIAEVAVPPQIPQTAQWRIRYVCAVESNSRWRAQLNLFARRYFHAGELAFYSPANMLTDEIPPLQPNPSVQRTEASRQTEETNRTPGAAGLRR